MISLDVLIGDSTYTLSRVTSNSVKCIPTSPPYATEVENLKGDQLLGDAFLTKMSGIFRECYRVLRPDGLLFLNIGDSAHNWFLSHDLVRKMQREQDWKLVHRIVWWKQRTKLVGTGGRFLGGLKQQLFDYDFIYVLAKGTEYKFNYVEDDVWTFWKKEGEYGYENPSIFPVELAKRCLKLTTEPGDIALDPFLGSGTTLAACREMERSGVGCELNNNYKRDIQTRIEWGTRSMLSDIRYRWIEGEHIEEIYTPKLETSDVATTFEREGLDAFK